MPKGTSIYASDARKSARFSPGTLCTPQVRFHILWWGSCLCFAGCANFPTDNVWWCVGGSSDLQRCMPWPIAGVHSAIADVAICLDLFLRVRCSFNQSLGLPNVDHSFPFFYETGSYGWTSSLQRVIRGKTPLRCLVVWGLSWWLPRWPMKYDKVSEVLGLWSSVGSLGLPQ